MSKPSEGMKVMTPKALSEEVGDYVRRYPGASFAELAEKWPEHFRAGDKGLELTGERHSNIFMWFSVSTVGVDALALLEKQGMEYNTTSLLVYMIDGSVPKVPIAKSERHYKSLRWLPVSMKFPPTVKQEPRG